ncbi:hypothetical protein P3G55_16175 [Leptospira sp. 96542]|nr:hypothetical protein [Leptospira sp. 96542]
MPKFNLNDTLTNQNGESILKKQTLKYKGFKKTYAQGVIPWAKFFDFISFFLISL